MAIRSVFEEQLRVLAECGIFLSASVTPDLLLRSFSREQYEQDPYRLLLSVMGGEPEYGLQVEGEVEALSENIWHLDMECVEDDGAYVVVAERMALLAQGDLPLENIDDEVDLEEGEAWLSVTLDGHTYKWQPRVNEDWLDPSILSRLAGLLAARDTGRRFTYIDLGGQDCLIGCATEEQRACLESRTGLKVEWLT